MKMVINGLGTTLQVPGAVVEKLGADDLAVAFAQLPREKDIGEGKKDKRAKHEEAGVPEIEPEAETERLEKNETPESEAARPLFRRRRNGGVLTLGGGMHAVSQNPTPFSAFAPA
jgi:hypothetical protein